MQGTSSLSIVLLAAALMAAGGSAHAAETGPNDALAVTRAKTTLVKAIAAAEAQVKGSAARAHFEDTKTGGVFEVEVVSGGKVFDVTVDADRGSVVSAKEDLAGGREEHDDED